MRNTKQLTSPENEESRVLYSDIDGSHKGELIVFEKTIKDTTRGGSDYNLHVRIGVTGRNIVVQYGAQEGTYNVVSINPRDEANDIAVAVSKNVSVLFENALEGLYSDELKKLRQLKEALKTQSDAQSEIVELKKYFGIEEVE